MYCKLHVLGRVLAITHPGRCIAHLGTCIVLCGGCVSEITLQMLGGIDSVKINTPPPWKKECNNTLTRGGMYWKLRPPRTERFAEVLILHPEAREIARGQSPRAISRAEGCKINAEANLEVRGGRNFQWIPTLVSVITFFFPRRGCFDFSFWPAHCVL